MNLKEGIIKIFQVLKIWQKAFLSAFGARYISFNTWRNLANEGSKFKLDCIKPKNSYILLIDDRNKWLGSFSISNKFVGPVMLSLLFILTKKNQKSNGILKIFGYKTEYQNGTTGKNYPFKIIRGSEIDSLYFNPLHH